MREAEQMLDGFRRRLWELHELIYDPDDHSAVLDWYDISLTGLIILNILAVVLETVASLGVPFAPYFRAFEVFSVAVFTLEYVARLWACTADSRYAHPIWGRLRYATTFMVLIDLLAFAPFYLPAVLPVDLRFMRGLRLFRLLWVLKLGRYSKSLSLLGRVLRAKTADLGTAVFGLLVLLVIAASVMYYVEHGAQPELFSSIPASMWWAVSTLTTVGYGDIYPITPLGKVTSSFISVLGIGLFALPAGILAAGFSEERQRQAAKDSTGACPHCGRRVD
jgi:voltage-gated potassium channel